MFNSFLQRKPLKSPNEFLLSGGWLPTSNFKKRLLGEWGVTREIRLLSVQAFVNPHLPTTHSDTLRLRAPSSSTFLQTLPDLVRSLNHEWALFISTQMSTNAVSTLQKGLGTNMTVEAT